MDNDELDGRGTHGYDNHLSSMKPIFFARGPNVKKNYQVSPFNSVDIYPLVAALLGIQPEPNNGTLENVKDFLRVPDDYNAGYRNEVTTFLTITVLTLIQVIWPECCWRAYEPSHEMALFVLRKLILQTCMRSHSVGLDVWFLVGPFVYFHTSCVRIVKALARLRRLTWAFAGRLCDK